MRYPWRATQGTKPTNIVQRIIVDNKPETKFLHYRLFGDNGIAARGGITVAYCEIAPGKLRVAQARCHTLDNFVKRQGRIKASGRLQSEKLSRTFEGTDRELMDQIDADLNNLNLSVQPATGLRFQRKFSAKAKKNYAKTEAVAATA